MQRTVGQEPSFVGRQDEIGALRRVLDQTTSGLAATALVEGEPGIGKSRLLAELLEDARRRGLFVRRGGADELERHRHFRAFIEALDLRPRAADPSAAAVGRMLTEADVSGDLGYQVTEAIVDLMEEYASKGPVVIGIEDLHWADASTVRTFRAIALRLRHVPIALIGTMRPSPGSTELTRTIRDVEEVGAVHLVLGPLGDDGMAEIVRDLTASGPGDRLRSHLARTGGNPLFAIELLRALSDEGALEAGETATSDLPPSFRLTILRRIAFLPDDTVELLKVAAVLGSTFVLEDLATTTERSVMELSRMLDPAIRSGLMEARDDRLAFRHDLVREAVYLDVPEPVRRSLHRDMAQRLISSGAPVGRVAEHVVLGAERGDAETARWLRERAREEASRSASAAVSLLEGAIRIVGPPDPEWQAVAADLARMLALAGRPDDAEELAREVLSRGPEPRVETIVRRALGDVLFFKARAVDALEQFELAERAAGHPERAHLASPMVRTMLGRLEEAREGAGHDLAEAERSGNEVAMSMALHSLANLARAQSYVDDSLYFGSRAVEIGRRTRHHMAGYVAAPLDYGVSLFEADRIDEGHEILREGRRRAEELGSASWLAIYQAEIAWGRFYQGAWDDCIAESEASMDLVEETGTRWPVAYYSGWLGVIAVHRDELDRAKELCEQAERELAADGIRSGSDWARWARASWLEANGRHDEAFSVLDELWRVMPMFQLLRSIGPVAVRLALQVGATDRAAQITQHGEMIASRARGVASLTASALHCRGLLEADPHILVRSVETYRQGPRPLDHARAAENAGMALLGNGHSEDARKFLQESVEQFEHLRATRDVSRLASVLRQLGVRRGARGRRDRPATGWDALTDTERRVVSLVATGLRNGEIAERLFISKRTVESHLSHVFRKVDAKTRAELVAEAVRRDLVS